MKVGILVFPGSNCDHDAWYAINASLHGNAVFIWHDSATLGDVDAVILPGGFSYGDYLRCGAIARFSPVMRSVVAAANTGLPVLGICNGFQILCEVHLLPGALVRNAHLHFRNRDQVIRIESTASAWTSGYQGGRQLLIPGE